jgi:methionyl-tRNA formyltransferase
VGLPFILPISILRQRHPDAKFINIHPSFLPDLRGADPVPGAILFRRDSGVTCHYMDEGIDTGPIIERVRIPYFESVDSKLLYSLCFKLEPKVFQEALGRNFAVRTVSENSAAKKYYTYKAKDRQFNPLDDDEDLISRVRAFNTPKKGFEFRAAGQRYTCFDAQKITESVVVDLFKDARPNAVVANFEDALLVRRPCGLIRLCHVVPAPTSALVGAMIQEPVNL